MLVAPGETIEVDAGFLRGHGAYVEDGELISSVCGRITRVNKLISVQPTKYRYTGEIGDLVVGRVSNVDSKRWKVNINSSREAVLQLSSVNLPDGAQRIRTQEDALQMREIFREGDLVSAEIQSINAETVAALHTRSLKYGKLQNGLVVEVPAALIKRLPQHYVSLECGVDVLLGVNGSIWITRTMPREWMLSSATDGDASAMQTETLFRLQKLHADTPIDADTRRKISRVRNSILVLAAASLFVTPEAIAAVYSAAEKGLITPPEELRIAPNYISHYRDF